ncbi:MAG: hypothetical protein CR988_00615 [Treponema sp.]|nr:MAG: hypothetical protein CR988_00615 [Treponema sp.]
MKNRILPDIFFILALCIFSELLFISCFKVKFDRGDIEMRCFEEKDFKKIELSGDMTVEVIFGNQFQIQVSEDKNMDKYLSIDKIQDTLKIKNTSVKNLTECKIVVTMPKISKCIVYGGCSVFIKDFNAPDDTLIVFQSGTSNINLENVLFKKIEASQNGTGKFLLQGKTNILKYSSSGTANLYASTLETEKVYLSWYGSGYAEVYAKEKLDIDISGTGIIKYKDKPEIVRSIRGSVNITRIN